ncbi:response regulator [Aspergillus lucknowensis]|uniref:CheY-like superfamily n=1 Tax=Aspergillus lucknowensis TaxID=176173 RepID=A0ABR4LDU1_9EURO
MHILVAEDNYVNQKVLEKFFKKLGGCTVSIVGDGQQALNYLSGPPATCPRPDIIIMDNAMPVMGGQEATRIIRTQPPFTTDPLIRTTPIIALVASMVSDRERYLAQGFDDVLHKPFRLQSLKRMILFWSRQRRNPAGGGAAGIAPLPPPVPVPLRPTAQWGPFPLRAFRGPRSLL